MALSPRMNASRTKLPPGQRWRERRLPRVCWDMAKTVKDLLAEANTTVPKLSPSGIDTEPRKRLLGRGP